MKIAMKTLGLALFSLCLVGCATPGLYQWGGYDAMLYASYKSPEKAVEFRQGLETHVTKMEQSQQKVAPGLYAQGCTAYRLRGDMPVSVGMYAKERDPSEER